MKILKAATIAVATMLMSTAAAMPAEKAIIVLDGSGSMWGQIDGVPKLEIARSALRAVLENVPASLELGLMAYGHREKGNCADIELLVPPRANSSLEIIAAADKMKFLGKTPISAAVRQAANELRFTEDKATVILITDGIETCEANPCAIAAELEAQGMDFTAHVVGFDLSEEEGKQVSCLAEATGGYYLPAGNAAELTEALAQVQSVVDLQPVVQEQAQSEPEPLAAAEVDLDGPDQVVAGANFEFSWSGSINGRDMITIVAAGAKEGALDSYIRAEDKTKGRLTAPGTPGLYELRYVLNADKSTLASLPMEVVDAEMGIGGPATVRAGENVDIVWSGEVNPRDMVVIVPAGAEENMTAGYIRTDGRSKASMRAPATAGLYEIRYVLNKNGRVLASASLEVVDAHAPLDDGAGLDVPATARPGAVITISWTGGSDSADQRVSLARADQADFVWIAAHKVGADKTLELKLPTEAGTYEVRYLDIDGRKILGRAIVEVK